MFSHGTTVHTYLISHAVVRFEEPSVDLYLTEWGKVWIKRGKEVRGSNNQAVNRKLSSE